MTEIRVNNAQAWVAVASFALLVITSAIGGTAWVAGELAGVRASVEALRLDVRSNTPHIDEHRALEREVRGLGGRVTVIETRLSLTP